MLFWPGQVAPGVWFFSDRISPKNAESMPYLRLAGLAVIAVAVAIRHRLLAILLLGAILFFDAPLYFLVYSSAGRFYNVALVALLLLTALLLCDPQFYRTIGKRPLAAGSAIALALAVGLGGQKLDDLMIASDGFRFASPFHASAPSRLAIRKAVAPRREEPVREPSSGIALADLAAAQTVTVTSEGDGVRFTAPVGRSRTIAAAPLPADFLTARNCRIRLEMKVSQGALGVGVETTDGAAPLLSEPVRPLPAGAPDFTPLDFNVPIG